MKIIRLVFNLKVTSARTTWKRKTTILKLLPSQVIESVFNSMLKKIININLRKNLLRSISSRHKLETSTKLEIPQISKIDIINMWFRKEN